MPETNATDIRETGQELLSLLDATETFLRVMAATHLPFASMLSIERAAHRRAREILAELGVPDASPSDDATDELLRIAVSPGLVDLGHAARQASIQVLAGEQGGGVEPEEAEPEPSHNEPSWIAYDDDQTESVAPQAIGEDEPLAEAADAQSDAAPAAASASEPSWVSYDEEELEIEPEEESYEEPETLHEAEPDYLAEEVEPEPASPDEPAPVQALDSGFVSFDDDDFEEESETQIFAIGGPAAAEPEPELELDPEPEPAPIDFGDVGQDALVTMDEPLELDDVSLQADDEGDIDLEDTAAHRVPPELEAFREPSPAEPEEVETFDLIPDLGDDLELDAFEDEEVTNVRPPAPAERAVAAAVPDDVAEVDVLDPDLDRPAKTPVPARSPRVQVASPRAQASPAVSAVPTARASAGLYGGGAVPTIRDSDAPRPRAAAIQINAAAGTGKVMGLEEEEEPIAIGAAEDYDEDYDDSGSEGGGFRLDVQEYEDDLEAYEEEDDEVVEAAPPPVPAGPVGPTTEEIKAIFEQARAAAEAGDMQRGADLFSDVIDGDPDNVDAHVGRGRLYLDLGDYTRAMSDFMVAEDIAPESPEPQIAIGDLYFARKDYRKAIEYFNAALEISPNHAMAFCRRGISHYYRKNYRDSLKDLQRAQEIDRDIPNIATYIAMAKKKAKK